MHKHLISLVLITIFIGSCAPAPASPTSPQPATTTQTIPPSETPLPTQTEIPTATPYPPLQTDGPYLLFTYDNKNFTIMDANGSGRKQFQLPNDGYIWGLDKAVSQDGKWLAYFTGSTEEPYDLALNLYNLSDGTSLLISSLIALGFPENLRPVIETIYFTEYDTDCSNQPDCQLNVVKSAFRDGIRSFDWSPDSKSIAFAAQIDGPSSDLYIYTLEDNITRRLTNEIENIGLMITWAPSGTKILYESSIPGTVYLSRFLRIADPNIKSLQNPKNIDGGLFWSGEGWVNEKSYLLWDGGEGAYPHDLRFINVETQQVKEIWKHIAVSFIIDKENQKVILLHMPWEGATSQSEQDMGIYMVSFDGTYLKIDDNEYYFFDQAPFNSYFAIDVNSQLINIASNKSVTEMHREIDNNIPPQAAPNQKWVIIPSDRGTELFSATLELIKLWDIHATNIIWRPDSEGVFLVDDSNFYYLSLDDKDLNLTKVCTTDDCLIYYGYVWLP